MVKVERSLLIAHSAQRMFDLVEDIEAYPDFLPWCARTEVSHRNAASTRKQIQLDASFAKTLEKTRSDLQADAENEEDKSEILHKSKNVGRRGKVDMSCQNTDKQDECNAQ